MRGREEARERIIKSWVQMGLGEDQNIGEQFNETLVDFVKENRFESLPNRGQPGKKKKQSGSETCWRSIETQSDLTEDDVTQDVYEANGAEENYLEVTAENMKPGIIALVIMFGGRHSVAYRSLLLFEKLLELWLQNARAAVFKRYKENIQNCKWRYFWSSFWRHNS